MKKYFILLSLIACSFCMAQHPLQIGVIANQELQDIIATWTANNSTLQPLDSNLKAVYHFSSSALIKDDKGINVLTNDGVSENVNGKYGYCGHWESSESDRMYITLNADLQPSDKITISAWVRWESRPAGQAIIVRADSTASSNYNAYYDGTANKLVWQVRESDDDYQTTEYSWTPTLATWYHLAFVADGTNVDIYVNGTLQGDAITYDGTIKTDAGTLGIGARSPNDDRFFDGDLDEVNIRKGHGMTSGEVTALYNSYNGAYYFNPVVETWTANNNILSARDSSLISYWKAENLLDSKYNHPLTNNGSATFTPGKYNDAFTLNGTTQYLTAVSHSNFNFVDGDFSVSHWVKFSNLTGNHVISSHWATGNEGWMIYTMGSTVLRFQYSTDGSSDIFVDRTVSLSTGTWYMITITRIGANLYHYVNAVQQGATYNISTNSIYNSTAVLAIGASGSFGALLAGQIDEPHIHKGTGKTLAEVQALYNSGTGSFYIPPPFEPTAIAGCELWLDAEGSGGRHYITANGDADIITSQVDPFGDSNGVGDFDGTGDYCIIPTSTDFDFGTSPFSFECWVRYSSTPTTSQFFYFQGDPASNDNRHMFFWYQTGAELYYQANVGGVGKAEYKVSWTPSTDTWYHLACVRNGTDLYMFINGVSQSLTTVTAISTNSVTLSGSFSEYIGRGRTGGADVDDFGPCVVSNHRVSNSARYIANFDVPTEAFTQDANTVFLAPMTGTNASTVFVDNALPSDTATIASFNDLSGNYNHARQSTDANRPTYQFDEVNSLPAIRYDGSNDVFSLGDNASLQNIFDSGGTIFIVSKPTSDGGGNLGRFFEKGWAFHVSEESASNVRLQLYYPFSGTDGGWKTNSAVMSISSFSLTSITYDNGNVANDPVIHLDGASQTLTETTTPTGTRTTDVGTTLYNGNRSALDRAFDGDIAEIIIYDTALSDTDRERVEKYLNDKYNIYFIWLLCWKPRKKRKWKLVA